MSTKSKALTVTEEAEKLRLVTTARNCIAALKRCTEEANQHAITLAHTLAELRENPKLWRHKKEDEEIGWERFCTEVLGCTPRNVLYHIGVGQVFENLNKATGTRVPMSNFAARALIGHEEETQAAAYKKATAGGAEATADSLSKALASVLEDGRQADAEAAEAGDNDKSHPAPPEHRTHRPSDEAVTAMAEALGVKATRTKTMAQMALRALIRALLIPLRRLLAASEDAAVATTMAQEICPLLGEINDRMPADIGKKAAKALPVYAQVVEDAAASSPPPRGPG